MISYRHTGFIKSFIVLAMTVLALSGCTGSSGTSSTPTAQVSNAQVKVDVTDAPSPDFSHVYVTVTAVGFHLTDTAGFAGYSSGIQNGWQVTRLAAPVTVDLAALTNGQVLADVTGTPLFANITLTPGTYKQIRLFLASTEDALTPSATAAGLTYNNEVQLVGDTTDHYPLRVPCPVEGIRLIPEYPVVVTAGGSLSIVLDFNLTSDVVETNPNGSIEYVLKPRLGYFDMSSVGAVTGTVAIAFSNLSTPRFVIKAEQNTGATYRVVRRWTTVNNQSGIFNLYPLPVFGNATTASYDIVVRGLGVETAIVKGVTVHKGSTLASGAANLGTINMVAGGQFTAQLAKPMHPSGAWIDFYQTISGDTVPYNIRDRHLDPYTGKFYNPIELSSSALLVASYTPGQALVFTPDSTSAGSFTVVASAGGYYGPGQATTVTGTNGQTDVPITFDLTYGMPQVVAPALPGNITTYFDMEYFGMGRGAGMGMGYRSNRYPTAGQLFATLGGMIMDSTGNLAGNASVKIALGNPEDSVVINDLPSGVAGTTYGLYAMGWGDGILAAGKLGGVSLESGSVSKTMQMY
jgi:hypothetical protein